MAKRNQVTTAGRFFIARHIRLTSTSGRQGAAPISGIRKGGQADNRFFKRRGDANREIHHTAASRGGTENPRTTRVKRLLSGNR